MVMNAILGGEAFKSRLSTRVRSDEGLAYSVGSSFGYGSLEPGAFTCHASTKNDKAYRTITIMKETIQEMIDTLPSDEEMKQSKETIINSFIHRWSSTRYALSQIAGLEINKMEPDYYKTYLDRVRAVTKDDVQRMANKYLNPDNVVVILVGKREEMKDLPGDLSIEKVTLPPEYME